VKINHTYYFKYGKTYKYVEKYLHKFEFLVLNNGSIFEVDVTSPLKMDAVCSSETFSCT